jgi:hypothetical protein
MIEKFEKITFDIKQKRDEYFSYITNHTWQEFLLSIYYADRVSYTKQADQVDFPRLLYIVDAFPSGFTVWQASANNKTQPVGYTGWYYVEKNTFDMVAQMQHNNIVITNRFFLPSKEKTPYLYLFNYSIAPALNHSQYSRELIKNYVSELSAIRYDGLFCATVSDDGIRIAEKFGMKKIGSINDSDDIYLYKKDEKR